MPGAYPTGDNANINFGPTAGSAANKSTFQFTMGLRTGDVQSAQANFTQEELGVLDDIKARYECVIVTGTKLQQYTLVNQGKPDDTKRGASTQKCSGDEEEGKIPRQEGGYRECIPFH